MSAAEKNIAEPDALALIGLLRQTRSLLACHLALGLSSYPATAELRRFVATHSAPPRFSGETKRPPPVPQRREETAPARQDTVLSVKDIAAQLVACRHCNPSAAPVPGMGSASPRLVVIGDCFLGPEVLPGLIWGQREDELFWRMMTAIQLDRNTVYVSNAFKCAQKNLPDLGSEEWRNGNCLVWLDKELRALRPPIVCAMGDFAARALIGKDAPLARLRRAFYPCCLPALGQISVMATYHPRFLLEEPSMKAAAWEDLQMLQRRIQALYPAPAR